MSAVQERERRVTAGQRISFLAGQELENDETFWTHDTWQEDSESFHSSDVDTSADEDVFDSDFDVSENENEELAIEEQIGAATEREIEQEERNNQNKKKNHAYSEVQSKKKPGVKQSFGGNKVAKVGGGVGRRWPGSVNGKRIVGDGLNAGIVLNVPIQYQKNYVPPTTATSTTATTTPSTLPQHHEQQSTNTTQSSPIPIPSIDNTQQPTIDATLSSVVPDNYNVSIPPVANTELHSTTPLLPTTTTSIPITTIDKRKKVTTGPTLAATRIRRSSYENKNVTMVIGNVRSRKSMTSIDQHQHQQPPQKVSPRKTPGQSQQQQSTTTILKRGKQLFSQEELLLEAVQNTEPENERWILGQKRNQDMKDTIETLLRNNTNSYDKNTKLIEKFISRRGYYNTITFPDMDHIPDILQRNVVSLSQHQQHPQTTTCIITGQVARYRDPKTGYGYYDSIAFRELRRRYEAKELLPLKADTTYTRKTQNGSNVNHQSPSQHHILLPPNEMENDSFVTTNEFTSTKLKSKRRSKAISNEPKTKKRKSTNKVNGRKRNNGEEMSNETESIDQNDLQSRPSNNNDNTNTIQENSLTTINGDDCLETNVEPSTPTPITSKVSDLEVVHRYKHNNHNNSSVMMPTTYSKHHPTCATTTEMVNVSSPTSPGDRKSPRTPKPSVKMLQQLMTLSSPTTLPYVLDRVPSSSSSPPAAIQVKEQIISSNNQSNIDVKTSPPILPDVPVTAKAITTISHEQNHLETTSNNANKQS
jgi:hypothetical protein